MYIGFMYSSCIPKQVILPSKFHTNLDEKNTNAFQIYSQITNVSPILSATDSLIC